LTFALCFGCGHLKFGALLPCAECQAGPTGQNELDITFSDQVFTVETLREFGDFVQTLHALTERREVQFWAFMQFLTEEHPSILTADTPVELRPMVTELLAHVGTPAITVQRVPSRTEPDSGVRPYRDSKHIEPRKSLQQWLRSVFRD
jgi:hypothetical protein